MNIILSESKKAIILAASIKAQCNTCKSIWGIYINLTDGRPPKNWDRCRTCEKKSNYSNNKMEMVNYGNTTIK